MSRATRITFGVFGVITAIVVAIGTFFLLSSFVSLSPISKINDAEAPYTSYFYLLYSLANAIFLSMLGIAAVRLFKNRTSGLNLLALTLKAELAYWIITSLFWFLPSPWGMSAAGATGIGNMGVAPQIFIAYPISGLLILWLLKVCNMLTLKQTAA